MEINNNINSPYLHASEDKSDNLTEEKMKIIHNESRNIHPTVEKRSQEIKLPSKSKSQQNSDYNKEIMATTSDIDVCEKSHNERVTKSIEVNKVHENIINDTQVLIKSNCAKIEIQTIQDESINKIFKEEKLLTQSGESYILFLNKQLILIHVTNDFR